MASPYELNSSDLVDIAHNSRILLTRLRDLEGILPPTEQRLEAICAEIEVASMMKRLFTIV